MGEYCPKKGQYLRTSFAHRQEKAINDCEGCNILRELLVETRHDEPDDSLQAQENDDLLLGSEPVQQKRAALDKRESQSLPGIEQSDATDDSSREVEGIDYDIPVRAEQSAECLTKLKVAELAMRRRLSVL